MLADLAIIFALVLANGLFAMAEMALVTARPSRLKQLADEGSASALRVLNLRREPERLLATVQVGLTLVSALAAALGGARVAGQLADIIRPYFANLPFHTSPDLPVQVAMAVVVSGVSFVTLVAGELVPKSIAMQNSERLALLFSRPLQWLSGVGRPAVWLLTATSNLLLRPFGDRTSFAESRVNREELRVLLEEAARTGTLDQRSSDIASRALDFSVLTASELAVPRNHLRMLDLHATQEQIISLFCEEGFHRMPVMDGHPDKVVGYVSATDVLTAVKLGNLVQLPDMLRPVMFIPAVTHAPSLLKQMQEKRQRLAMVVDEHGGVMGMVTMDDLTDELVGEIRDGKEAPELVKALGDGKFLVAGVTSVRDLERATGLRLPDDVPAETVAGVVLSLAGEIPQPGATFDGFGAHWKVATRTDRRIKQVELTVKPPSSSSHHTGTHPT